jgi:ubiquinone biosynthesis protein Coq4
MALVAPADTPEFRVSTKREWGHAFRALRRLLDDRDDTTQVFEVMRALNGSSTVDGYRRLLASSEGGRIAYERSELARRLMDDAWLDTLPAGSVGAPYRQFIRAENLRPTAWRTSAARDGPRKMTCIPTPGSAAASATCMTSAARNHPGNDL